MEADGFWNNRDKANEVVQTLKGLKTAVAPMQAVDASRDEIAAMLELAAEDDSGEMLLEAEKSLEKLRTRLGKLEFQAMMTYEADPMNAFVTIHAGAGGTESCDWTSMMYRMYTRWAEERGFGLEEIDLGPGEVAGIRSVTFAVRGEYAYGYLRGEAGVHRLVRISPFDAQARRQTSFASVDVVAEIDDTIEVSINEEEIIMETFTSGGPGGQHQNKTASGVRLRYRPYKDQPTFEVVAESRAERSQHKNKATCMKVLRAKLYQIEREKREAELAKHNATKLDNSFGSQIRNYVLAPYKLVKDLRTNFEVGNADGVLDGKLDPFMESYLRAQIGKA
jgi:peptide chain release factor 2